jgi:hypothetical protein
VAERSKTTTLAISQDDDPSYRIGGTLHASLTVLALIEDGRPSATIDCNDPLSRVHG